MYTKRLAIKKGAWIGVAACLFLFVFYYLGFAFASQEVSQWLPLVSLGTGHSVLVLAGYALEGESLFCPAVQTVCTVWTQDQGCVTAILTPKAACVTLLQQISFVLVSLGLVGVYALIGGAIGTLVHKIRQAKSM